MLSFIQKLMPKETSFYDDFNQLSVHLVQASQEVQQLLGDLSKTAVVAKRVNDLEHAADLVAHAALDRLQKTFITPMDRELISELVDRLDNVVDNYDAACKRLEIFDLGKLPSDLREMGEVCVKICAEIQSVVNLLTDLKDGESIKKHCLEIRRLENVADDLVRQGLKRLFSQEQDFKRLLQEKEVFAFLERIADDGEALTRVIDKILLDGA